MDKTIIEAAEELKKQGHTDLASRLLQAGVTSDIDITHKAFKRTKFPVSKKGKDLHIKLDSDTKVVLRDDKSNVGKWWLEDKRM